MLLFGEISDLILKCGYLGLKLRYCDALRCLIGIPAGLKHLVCGNFLDGVGKLGLEDGHLGLKPSRLCSRSLGTKDVGSPLGAVLLRSSTASCL